MTYPFDQFIAFNQANVQLFQKITGITRSNGQKWVQLGTQSASEFASAWKALQPGKLPALENGGTARLRADAEKIRQDTLEQVKDAIGEWQGAFAHSFGEGGQKAFADTVQAMFRTNPKTID